MSWAWRFRLGEHLRTALWPVPALFGLSGLLVGMAMWRLDHWLQWALFGFEPKGATALTATIVGATLTFLGTAFSVLLVVVQFASTQLTPRALRVSLSDPLYRLTLGLFTATFLYAIVILGRITDAFVPQLGVGLASILVVISLGAYVVLISHLRTSLRPVIVAARVGRQGLQTLQHTYPEAIGPAALAGPAADAGATGPARTVPSSGPPGILVAFDTEGLVAEARRLDAEIALVPAPGTSCAVAPRSFAWWSRETRSMPGSCGARCCSGRSGRCTRTRRSPSASWSISPSRRSPRPSTTLPRRSWPSISFTSSCHTWARAASRSGAIATSTATCASSWRCRRGKTT